MILEVGTIIKTNSGYFFKITGINEGITLDIYTNQDRLNTNNPNSTNFNYEKWDVLENINNKSWVIVKSNPNWKKRLGGIKNVSKTPHKR